jgi:hypothetical protein
MITFAIQMGMRTGAAQLNQCYHLQIQDGKGFGIIHLQVLSTKTSLSAHLGAIRTNHGLGHKFHHVTAEFPRQFCVTPA